MLNKQRTGNFILLPAFSMTSGDEAPQVTDFLVSLNQHKDPMRPMSLRARSARLKKERKIEMKVLDSIHENGAKLVSVDRENLAELRLSYPGVQIVPEVLYSPAWAPKAKILQKVKRLSNVAKTHFEVRNEEGNPIPDIEVIAFTNFKTGEGEKGFTRKNGTVSLNIPPNVTIERVYFYPEHSYWPVYITNPKVKGGEFSIVLETVVPSFQDAIRHFYKPHGLPLIPGNVTVAVVDSGVGPHNDLPLISGMNMVQGQSPLDFGDVSGHGTHVAGIIGAIGDGKNTYRGIAAGTNLRSYRVFPDAKNDASNFDIMKAIDQAVMDNCDLINLSLGGSNDDPAVSLAITEAYNKGVVCFAATGNEYRSPVCYPAAAQFSIAVSALGRKGTWPKNSTQRETAKSPYGAPDKTNYIADFSNIGPQVDMVAPGVGIVSTYPSNLYAAMDGTSMACPAAVGSAARLLSNTPAVVGAEKNISRSNEIVKLFSNYIKSLGFGAEFEGKGILTL
jgi:subtilisin